ncbi:MAG TPA: protein kinase [Polyangiaceae bacterium]|jgi:serine/threonine-protein kinase|nr:protein kinase [Polyangiaceae bacterium]
MTAEVREGEIIAGKYRVDRVLGVGGMGVVVAAEHLQLGQRVAIKFLLEQTMTAPDSVARFVREAQAAARIQSEHVARVLDVATLETGAPYMVMEFLEGCDLAELLEKRGPLPLIEAVGYLLEACEGVAEAHAAGIVHRDLKPANLFLCQRGAGRTLIKVLDFGISKAQTPSSAPGAALTLTKTSAIVGSPVYMSPEQMASAKTVDARTDIWSLGVSLFELVTGQRPFGGETLTELIANVLRLPPPSVRELQASIPSEFETALAGSLEKERAQRYQTVADFAAAIAPFGPSHSSGAVERIAQTLGVTQRIAAGIALDATQRAPQPSRPVPVVSAQAVAHGTTSKAVWAATEPASALTARRSRAPAILGGALLVAVSSGAWLHWRGDGTSAPTTGSAVPPAPSAQGVASTARPSASADSTRKAPTAPDAGLGGAAGVGQSSSDPSATALPPPLPQYRKRQDLFDRRE